MPPTSSANQPRRTLLLTGASRHRARHRDPLLVRRLARPDLLAASVSGGLSVGRRPRGPHPGRPCRPCRHHARDSGNPPAAKLRGRRAACAGQQCCDFAEGLGGTRLGTIETDVDTWSHVFRVNFFAPIMMARGIDRGIEDGEGLGRQRHLDCRRPRAPVRGRGLRHLQGGIGFTHTGNGL